MKIATLVKNKDIRSSTPYFYSGSTSTGYWLKDGMRYTDEEFAKLYPVSAVRVRSKTELAKGFNVDGKQLWQQLN